MDKTVATATNTLHSQIPPPRPRRHLSRPPSSLAAGPDAGPAAGQGRLSGGRGAGRRLQHLRPRSARREAARHVVLSLRAGQEEVRDLSKCTKYCICGEGRCPRSFSRGRKREMSITPRSHRNGRCTLVCCRALV